MESTSAQVDARVVRIDFLCVVVVLAGQVEVRKEGVHFGPVAVEIGIFGVDFDGLATCPAPDARDALAVYGGRRRARTPLF